MIHYELNNSTDQLMQKTLKRACDDMNRINSSPYKWATIEIERFTYETVIRVSSGARMSDGEKDQPTKTTYYAPDYRGGKVYVSSIVHN